MWWRSPDAFCLSLLPPVLKKFPCLQWQILGLRREFWDMWSAAWLPQLSPQVWVLVAGRFLSQIGSGIVLFYVPIYFVNQVGLSATAVGIGLSSGAIAHNLSELEASAVME
ncbi:hypothetical protein WA1_00555 [Scytonema hofmannii PCC 7110]|uniref:Major facilitator superfamily (MFS) profile domain-containing protein n=2 Tax=Scytonema hofmannii TaxID=34078 RepID=A0A139XG69_9CYAN|nr:hypothetical protein WA1_00555 [Scytonema hofmannii PCC 7110]